jgi:hypothetical protein
MTARSTLTVEQRMERLATRLEASAKWAYMPSSYERNELDTIGLAEERILRKVAELIRSELAGDGLPEED